MAKCETKRAFRAGEELVREGEQGHCAYIIESGRVEILINRDGQDMLVGTRGPGALIGEMAIIDRRPRIATVRALEDCEVLEITEADLARLIEESDPVLRMVIRVLLTRYRDTLNRSQLMEYPTGSTTAEEIERSDQSIKLAVHNVKIANEFGRALKRNELELYYQPIVSLKSGSIMGFEALMRWNHPKQGMILPGGFIPITEKSELIGEASWWALRKACVARHVIARQLGRQAGEPAPLFMSVNLSARSFDDSGLVEQIVAILAETATDPAWIKLEVTESLLMQQPEAGRAVLDACREKGLSIALDDFGTGYSSLSYLHCLPIDTLKIDRSFIQSMLVQEMSLELVKSIIGLGQRLGMTVVAEGVETQAAVETLQDLGCGLAQGYWYAKPLPLAGVLDLFEAASINLTPCPQEQTSEQGENSPLSPECVIAN